MMLNNQVYKKTKVLTMLNFIQIQLYRKLKIADKPALDNSSYTGGGGGYWTLQKGNAKVLQSGANYNCMFTHKQVLDIALVKDVTSSILIRQCL